jgi:hypothetical protein
VRSTKQNTELGLLNLFITAMDLKWDAAGLSKPNAKVIGMTPQEYSKLIDLIKD